jgi:hypothetical protein
MDFSSQLAKRMLLRLKRHAGNTATPLRRRTFQAVGLTRLTSLPPSTYTRSALLILELISYACNSCFHNIFSPRCYPISGQP